MEKMAALILAGGRGKRMDVLCHVRPKPALPFAGRFRVIDFTLSNCVYSGINDLFVLTDYHRNYMARYLRQWSLTNSAGTFHILEPRAGSYMGTADAVYQNLPSLDRCDTENVLILAGDHIYKMDYGDMLDFHERTGAAVTVGVIRVPIEDAHRFGTVSVAQDGRILDFIEKSRHPRSDLASMGIYVFNRGVLKRRLKEDAGRPDSSHDFGYSILPGMVKKDRVMAYEFTGYWQDIGTPQAYYNANMELIRSRPSFSLNSGRTVLTRGQDMPPPDISGEGTVVNSLVSPGCVIRGRVENSILSPGVWVDERAEVHNSVLMPDVFVGYHSVVEDSIIDEGVRLGKLCYIGFGKPLIPGDIGITVLGKGSSIPSHTSIGCGSRVLPNVDASSFGGTAVAPGSVVSQQGVTREKRTKDVVGI